MKMRKEVNVRITPFLATKGKNQIDFVMMYNT